MKNATNTVANLKKGDQVTYIKYSRNGQETLVRVVGTAEQHYKQKRMTGESNILILGTPVFNLLNNAKLYKISKKRISNKYIIKVKLLEVIKAKAKWYTITRLKQLFGTLTKKRPIK